MTNTRIYTENRLVRRGDLVYTNDRDGSLTTQYAGNVAQAGGVNTLRSNEPTGERYRWIGENGGTATETGGGYAEQGGRYGTRGVTLYGNGEAAAVSYSSSAGSRSMYLGKDVMGSVRSVTGDSGSIEGRYEYDAFGKPYRGDLAGGMNLGYMGKPYDAATGLYNYGYRDYKPQAARFTTVDPIRDGSNWFAYVNNDPVNWVDPWGLSASDQKGNEKPSVGQVVLDIIGKIWAAPMTAIGIVTGTVLTGVSIITGNGGSIGIANNAIYFTSFSNSDKGGAITFGNAIIYVGANKDSPAPCYDGNGKVNLGRHEEAHTYQYQQLGIFTIPLIIVSAVDNGGQKELSFNNLWDSLGRFLGHSELEKAADDYARKFDIDGNKL